VGSDGVWRGAGLYARRDFRIVLNDIAPGPTCGLKGLLGGPTFGPRRPSNSACRHSGGGEPVEVVPSPWDRPDACESGSEKKSAFGLRILRALKLKPIWQHSPSKEHIRRLLQETIDEAGNQSEWCRHVGVDRTWLNKMLNGRVPIGLGIVKILKINRIYVQSD